MNKTIMIIVGAVCVVLLIILIAAIIPRLKQAVSRTPLWVYLLLVVAVVGVISFVGIQLFGPKGQDSLLSVDVEGNEVGDAEHDTPLEEKSEEKGTHFNLAKALEGNITGDDTIYIIVHENLVSIGATDFEDKENFEAALDSLVADVQNPRILLQDNYALASKYHEVKKDLDDRGLNYSEQPLE